MTLTPEEKKDFYDAMQRRAWTFPTSMKEFKYLLRLIREDVKRNE